MVGLSRSSGWQWRGQRDKHFAAFIRDNCDAHVIDDGLGPSLDLIARLVAPAPTGGQPVA